MSSFEELQGNAEDFKNYMFKKDEFRVVGPPNLEPKPERTIKEVLTMHPDISVERDELGGLEVVQELEHFTVRIEPYWQTEDKNQAPSVRVQAFREGQPEEAMAEIILDVHQDPNTQKNQVGITAPISKAGAPDTHDVLWAAKEGVNLFQNYLKLTKDDQGKFPAGKVNDNMQRNLAADLQEAGVPAGVGQLSGYDQPEAAYAYLSQLVGAAGLPPHRNEG